YGLAAGRAPGGGRAVAVADPGAPRGGGAVCLPSGRSPRRTAVPDQPPPAGLAGRRPRGDGAVPLLDLLQAPGRGPGGARPAAHRPRRRRSDPWHRPAAVLLT